MQNNNYLVAKFFLSIGSVFAVCCYKAWKKGDLSFHLENGHLRIEGKINGISINNLRLPLPNAEKIFSSLDSLNKQS